ncbi:Cell surface superoxide dismutase [Cu-Zn] 4 [Vermiconidia calcicola]|uniref:Cell surface superoxide dismutase [Cu-Zn] 4 n=1 Tax=Vermiconidia calcicola TaxID=1690605 RepID=A0ACC3MCI2_9PEZI|nr:Cell surface superoxide dismutase [Cu-Zn] 4 [Vermiconidia calcicola]
MRYISNIAAAAALVSAVAAGDAPVVNNDQTGTTWAANLPDTGAGAVGGAVLASNSPDGAGTNFQISLSNLPGSGGLSYALHTGRVSGSDCSGAGAVLDPYAGTTGASCARDKAACQVGALSDKHGAAEIISGGSGTGYFAATYVDEYVSMEPGNDAFFGRGSFVVMDQQGVAVTCANFRDASIVRGNTTTTESSSSAPSATSGGRNSGGVADTGSDSGSASSTSSEGFAVRTAAPFVGAGVLGMAALLF